MMTKRIKKELEDETKVLACAQEFGLVGDPTRMKICWLLCQHKEMSVGGIAELLGVSDSVVSHALQKLKKHQMVKVRRDRKHAFYALGDSPFTKVVKHNLQKYEIKKS